MEFRIVDFQILTRSYQTYVDGVNEIEKEKSNFLLQIEPHRKELNSIISYASSGLIMDKKTQQEKSGQFQRIQQELVQMDSDFKFKIKKMSDDLNEKCYDELSEIIQEWSEKNNIDIVLGKMEVVFCKENLEITNGILDILKEANMYVEYIEEEIKKEN
jgi:Skp family chaperone for outer membrane proteins